MDAHGLNVADEGTHHAQDDKTRDLTLVLGEVDLAAGILKDEERILEAPSERDPRLGRAHHLCARLGIFVTIQTRDLDGVGIDARTPSLSPAQGSVTVPMLHCAG